MSGKKVEVGVSPKCKTSERELKGALLSLRNLHCCLADNGSPGDCGAVGLNRRSAGCVRVSAWGPGPKAPFSACHNKPEQGLVFTGSPAILYYLDFPAEITGGLGLAWLIPRRLTLVATPFSCFLASNGLRTGEAGDLRGRERPWAPVWKNLAPESQF